jgi:dienelactone hydrolase
MVFHPEQPQAPQEVFERVAAWLAQAPPPAQTRRVRPPGAARAAEIVLDVDGTPVRESPLTVPWQAGRLAGVLAEPVDAPPTGLCAVFLNAGAVRRVGPNRMWVEAARRWAARGVRALRIDLEGIGDADGDGDRFRDVTQFYAPRLVDQVGVVLDALEERGLGGRFVLTGLCSGGYWAFQAARQDARVGAALLVNAGALVWDDDLVTRREARKVGRLYQLDWWRKIMHGDVTQAQMRAVARAYVRTTLGRHAAFQSGVERDLDHLRDAGTRLVLAFSGDEALHAELQEEGILTRLERWPNVALEHLPARDHTLRPIVAQRAVRELFDRQLAVELTASGDLSGAGVTTPAGR